MNKKNKKIVVLGCNSDIGTFLCNKWLDDGYDIVGTYRKTNKNLSALNQKGLKPVKIDFSNVVTAKKAQRFLDLSENWNIFLSCVGDTEPLDLFINTNIEKWFKSFQLNFDNQVRVLHYLLNKNLPSSKKSRSILFLAGGAMNSATKYMSAYTISKIALTKFVELAQFENEYDKYTIIGPGWIKTKIHQKTLNVKGNASELNKSTEKKLRENYGNSLHELQKMLDWIISSSLSLVGGRNFSLTSDNWKEPSFQKKTEENSELFKLRRYQDLDT